MIKYLVLIFATLSLSLHAEEQAKATGSFKFFKKRQTTIKNPFELRDPFRRNLPKRARRKVSYGQMQEGGLFSNIETIENVPIEQLKVVGVLLGPNRRAMVKIMALENPDIAEGQSVVQAPTTKKDNEYTYVIKEGMKLGVDGAEVKAILPGGIVLVERIRNVYDQDEYLETIIPVSE